jgi:hypothetical protein
VNQWSLLLSYLDVLDHGVDEKGPTHLGKFAALQSYADPGAGTVKHRTPGRGSPLRQPEHPTRCRCLPSEGVGEMTMLPLE